MRKTVTVYEFGTHRVWQAKTYFFAHFVSNTPNPGRIINAVQSAMTRHKSIIAAEDYA
jgi:hypothetical protein